jgi:hypothetical protein
MADKPLKKISPTTVNSINKYLKSVQKQEIASRYKGGRGGKRAYKQGDSLDRLKSKLLRRYNQAKVNTSLFYNVGKGITSGTVDKTLKKAGFDASDYRDRAKVKGALRKTVSGRRGSLSLSNVANQMTLGYATLAGMAVGAPKGIKRNVKSRTGTKSRTRKGLFGATAGRVVGAVKTRIARKKYGKETTAQMRKRINAQNASKRVKAFKRTFRTKFAAESTGVSIQKIGQLRSGKFRAASGMRKKYVFTPARKRALAKARQMRKQNR